MDREPRRCVGILLALALGLAGCHSAMLQTARTHDGTRVTVGAVRVRADHDGDVSDYTVFIKGEVGKAAHRHRAGYSLAVTVISPLSNGYRDAFSDPGVEYGTFPNEWTAVYPEMKLQAPRVLPVDVALDIRLMAYMPERAALITSYDIASHAAIYASYAYVNSLGTVFAGGAEVMCFSNLALLAEYSAWLTDHEYPDAYAGPRRRRPYSFGLALSYRLPRTAEAPDPRTARAGSDP